MMGWIGPHELSFLLGYLLLTMALSAAITTGVTRIGNGRIAFLAPFLGSLLMPAGLIGWAAAILVFYPERPSPDDAAMIVAVALLILSVLTLPFSTAASAWTAERHSSRCGTTSSSRRSRLHVVGYVATAIVAFEIVGVAVASVSAWLQQKRIGDRYAENTRTAPFPLAKYETSSSNSPILLNMRRLRSLAAMDGDGIRFFAMPALGLRWYSVAVYLPMHGDTARGQLIVTDQHRKGDHVLSVIDFTIAKPAYAAMATALDRETSGYPGYRRMCVDGTYVAFEQVHGQAVTSGSGSASCSDHYEAVSLIVLRGLSQAWPRLPLPQGGDWMPPK
ncbi:hypothetical protein [Sphingomonas sp.]|uniref:hypothetical protein n=1 Tax=Sphingomonas sp. TaxID=28214 RepID=UPI003AFFCA29